MKKDQGVIKDLLVLFISLRSSISSFPMRALDIAIQPEKPYRKKLVTKEVRTSRELKNFMNFPDRLYRGTPYYVPPLRSNEKVTLLHTNPAFTHCEAKYWLACRGRRIVGRIAGIVNYSYNSRWRKKCARFGWFDFEEDETVAKLLLQQVEQWARELGMDAVHGPMGFTNFDPAGMLIEGFDQVATLGARYNYPYYHRFVEQCGYGKEVDWVEYKINIPEKVPDKISQLASIVKRRNQLNVVDVKDGHVKCYAHAILELVNTCYSHLHGMVPLTERQIEYYTRRYLAFIRENYVSLIANRHGELVAFGITMPSLSHALQKAKGHLFPLGFLHIMRALRRNNTSELCLIAIRPDYQGKGVNALLMEEINKAYIRNKIKVAESNPELEDNAKVQAIWSYYDARLHKRRRCYLKSLS